MMIQFPVKREPEQEESGQGNAVYANLKALLGVCESVEACNFYLGTAETAFERGRITEAERDELRGIGRARRIELARPDEKTIQADGPGCYLYYPENRERAPENAQIHAVLLYYGRHYGLYTTLDLKGRGICLEEGAPTGYPAGTKRYTVTTRAFEKLKERYIIALEADY